MARKPTPTTIDAGSTEIVVPAEIEAAAHAHDAMQSTLLALADQLGYDGSLSVGTLEDGIRFYQRRSVEALLEVGTRLILLKEQLAHGEFTRRVELLGFSDRTARRFMQAALKTAKSANLADLSQQIQGASKFLELVTMDDDDLAALKEGGTVAGLTLDDVDKMSASELRAALREARENEQAMGRVLQDKNTKLDKLATEHKKPSASALKGVDWPEAIDGLKDDAHNIGKVMDEILVKHQLLIDATEVVYQQLPEDSHLNDAYKGVVFRLGEQIERLCTLAAVIRNQYELKLSGYVALDKSYILPAEQFDLAE